MADNIIDSLQIEVTSTTKDALTGLTKIKNSLQKLSEMSHAVAQINNSGISKLKEMAGSLRTLAEAGSNPGLSAAVSELRKLSQLNFSKLTSGSEQIDKLSQSIRELRTTNTSPVTGGVTGGTVAIQASTEIEETKARLVSLKTVGSQVWSIIKSGAGSFFGYLKTVGSGAIWLINRGLKTMISGFGLAAKGVWKLVSGIGSLIKMGWKKLTNSISEVSKKLSRLPKAFARVAMYAAFRAIIRQITEALQEGTNNLYQYSKALGGEFASSMDKIATSMQYFKNSVGAMVAPLINALAPAIEYVTDKIVQLLNYLNQLFAKITGASTWTKAVKVQTEYAESATEAAEAAKSLTAGFDELNVLSDSSSSSDSNTPDYGSMFEEVPLDSNFASWVDDIKAMIDAGDWSGLGTYLGEKINGLVDAIDWAGWGTKLGKGIQAGFEFTYAFLDTINFDKIGSSIATLLNHAMYEIDFSLVGATLMKKWTIIVDTVYGFVTTLDWGKVGQAVGDGLNGALAELDFAKAVNTAQTGILGLLTSLRVAIKTFDWAGLGAEIAEGINDINWVELLSSAAGTLSDAVVGCLEGISELIYELDWAKLGDDIWNSLVGIVESIDWNGIIDLLFEGLGAAIGGISLRLVNLCEEIGNAFLDSLSYFDPFIEEAGGDVMQGLLDGMWAGICDIGNWIVEHIFDPFIEGFKDAFGIASPSKEMKPLGEYIVQGLLEGITSVWSSITGFFSEKLENIKQTISTAWSNVKTTTSEKWKEIKSDLSQKWSDIQTKASETWDSIKSTASETWSNIETTASTKWSEIKTTVGNKWSEMKKSASETWNDIKTSASSTWSDISSKASTDWSDICSDVSSKWSNLETSASDTFESVKSTISGVWDDISEKITSVASSIWDTLSGWWDDIKGLFSGLGEYLGDVKETVSGAWNTVSNVASNIGDAIANGVGNVLDWVSGIDLFAGGGYPDQGQLFIARESGAELVGSIGGRTAVANNDQIVEGIYQGVLAAMQDSGSGNGDATSFHIYIDGKEITAAVERRQSERGATIYKGGVLNGI